MTKNYLKISVITPSLNQAEFIEETINSVLAQNYPRLEYIIADGGSTDRTQQLAAKYKGKLKFYSREDRGQSEAINNALKMTTGDILCYLNSDDYLEANTLNIVNQYFLTHKTCQWLTGKCFIVNERGDKTRSLITYYKNLWLKLLKGRRTLMFLNYISQPSTFWRRSVFEKVGFFNEQYHYCMDYDYWLRISSLYSLDFVDAYLSSFRVHNKSKGSMYTSRLFEEGQEVLGNHTKSELIKNIHKTHDMLILQSYNILKKYE